MSRCIIHKDGAYNIFSTVVDAPLYETALTLDELREEIIFLHGSAGLNDLQERVMRAQTFGTSMLPARNLESLIQGNRAGHQESKLSYTEFIAQYLTLPKEQS